MITSLFMNFDFNVKSLMIHHQNVSDFQKLKIIKKFLCFSYCLSLCLALMIDEQVLPQGPVLIDVATEVCCKVGGIYTVLSTKVTSTVQEWGSRYGLIGKKTKQRLNPLL